MHVSVQYVFSMWLETISPSHKAQVRIEFFIDFSCCLIAVLILIIVYINDKYRRKGEYIRNPYNKCILGDVMDIYGGNDVKCALCFVDCFNIL